MNVYERLTDVVSQQLGVDKLSLEPDTSFADDLGADSLDVVELIIGVESEFDIDIPDEEMENFVTISDVAQYITDRI